MIFLNLATLALILGFCLKFSEKFPVSVKNKLSIMFANTITSRTWGMRGEVNIGTEIPGNLAINLKFPKVVGFGKKRTETCATKF